MRHLLILLVAFLILLGIGAGAQDARDTATFVGEVMDNMCASNGSHVSMMDKMHAKNAKECAQECVHAGGRYVLYARSAAAIYELDDQTRSEGFAGQTVAVTGNYDAATKMIHVTDIAVAPRQGEGKSGLIPNLGP